MTTLQVALFALLALLAVMWFAGIARLARTLKERQRATYEALRLDQLSREARSRLNLMGNDATRSLVRFIWRREDAALADPQVTKVVLALRRMLFMYVALLVVLAISVLRGGT